ncbi:MAG: tetratricopeptide repeat protein [Chitinophagaceae bacterium]|nr:tetratricopeptide repeat protein [Chitinophagaceae bacterium]
MAQALELDSIGLKLCETENANFQKSSFYDNMANCYMYSNRFVEAEKYFRLCLDIDSSFDNKKQISDTYLNLGNLMLMQKKYNEAETYLNHSIVLADSTGYKQGKYSAYLILSDLYKATNQYEKAFTSRAIINAEENERKRIAADLHDGVGQMMSAAK